MGGGGVRRVGGKEPRIVALGNPDRGDDGAALIVAERFHDRILVLAAGRPGAGLLDLLLPEHPCLLLDVTVSGSPPGTLHRAPLESLVPGAVPDTRFSSHGFGPGEALALALALGRSLPDGMFLGIEGAAFRQGSGLSPAVSEGLPAFEDLVRETLRQLALFERQPQAPRGSTGPGGG